MCKPVSAIYNEAKHKDEDYITQSATRTEISLSDKEGKTMWAVASKDVGLGEDL